METVTKRWNRTDKANTRNEKAYFVVAAFAQRWKVDEENVFPFHSPAAPPAAQRIGRPLPQEIC